MCRRTLFPFLHFVLSHLVLEHHPDAAETAQLTAFCRAEISQGFGTSQFGPPVAEPGSSRVTRSGEASSPEFRTARAFSTPSCSTFSSTARRAGGICSAIRASAL